MHLDPANQSQLIRSSQKDDYYQAFLRNKAGAALHTLAGSRLWLDWRKEVELLSDFAYYGLTTLSGCQTLGEEYVNIIQVDPGRGRIPSRARRGVFVLFRVFCPYLLDKVLVCLENELDGGRESCDGVRRHRAASGLWSLEAMLRRWMRRALAPLPEPRRTACLPVVLLLRHGVALLHRLHIALFYISGRTYHLSKRAAGIGYVRGAALTGGEAAIRSCYKLLGVVSLLQLLVNIWMQLSSWRRRRTARQEWKLYRKLSPRRAQGVAVPRCVLCLEGRRHATSTPCGHLFCWECITGWRSARCAGRRSSPTAWST
ncbi:peroxisome biogenesis factor 10 isoform X2 [Brachionichthys hirsutus]|uniref:peroxisome biogenesis factor 10 isoform X2 n=1 Tax=Brachionichthys hirsutus TaxID=412623 RepID=UPI0036048F0C